MKISLDDDIIKKSGFKIVEVLLILAFKLDNFAMKTIQSLLTRGILVNQLDGAIVPFRKYSDKISEVLLDSEKTQPNDTDIEQLADKMRELFPEGKKPGTPYYWRGSTKDITMKLKKFFKLYGDKYTSEQILAATKEYVESFNGIYTTMRLLKYFIMKSVVRDGGDEGNYNEPVSDLAEFMDNAGQKSLQRNWTTRSL